VLELVDRYEVGEVLITSHLRRESWRDPAGPVMYLLDELGVRLVPVHEVAAGATRRWGRTRWRWLHPPAGSDFASVNDASMVISVEAARRTLLLCGDVQRDGLEAVGPPPRADVVELPHHGSRTGASRRGVAFVTAAEPSVVLQSTGRRRWIRTGEAWTATLPGVQMLSTARDGACTVEIDADGTIRVSRFRGD
jgi:beta-lactamase superfamily II metal-dependent hydrolase